MEATHQQTHNVVIFMVFLYPNTSKDASLTTIPSQPPPPIIHWQMPTSVNQALNSPVANVCVQST